MMSDKELDRLELDMKREKLELETRDTIHDFVGRLHHDKRKEVVEIFTTRFYVINDGFAMTKEITSIIERLQKKKLTNHLAR